MTKHFFDERANAAKLAKIQAAKVAESLEMARLAARRAAIISAAWRVAPALVFVASFGLVFASL